jgi:glycosyltransferase involved in cell wall biosynthesis
MKVAVFGGYAPSLPWFRGPMMRAMVEAGHEVIGLAPGEDPTVIADLAEIGVGYKSIPLGRTGLNPLEDLRTLRAITSALEEIRPDLLLSYTIKPAIYGSLAAARVGIPHRHAMITGLGSTLMGEGLKMRCMAIVAKWLYRHGMANNEGVFFQNPDDFAFFERNKLLSPDCRITLINGSGVDMKHFALAPQPTGPLTFLLVGRLTREKGVKEFVEAARIIKNRHPEVRCQMLGSFDSNPSAISASQVTAWEREGIIQYLGTAKDVRPILAEAHVLVLPSYGEGTPRSVLEAMATGRAVVTTLAPGCKETVIDGKTGFLVAPKNPAALAEAMRHFQADPSLAAIMGKAARAYAEDKYDVNKVNVIIMKALGL